MLILLPEKSIVCYTESVQKYHHFVVQVTECVRLDEVRLGFGELDI